MARVTLTRSFFMLLAVGLVFAGGFILWQIGNQPSPNGCYYFPAGTLSVFFPLQAYQSGCPFNSLPNYYAGDVALGLQVLGILIAFTRISRSGARVG